MAMIRVLVNPIPMAIICSVIQGTKYRLLLFLEPRYNKTDTDWEAIEVNITEIDKKRSNEDLFFKRYTKYLLFLVSEFEANLLHNVFDLLDLWYHS